MPVTFESSRTFFFSFMIARVAFAVGWVASWWHFKGSRPLDTLSVELDQVREEVALAREAIQEARALSSSCEWDLWWSQWVVRANVIFEISLLFFLLSRWWPWKTVERIEPADFEIDSVDLSVAQPEPQFTPVPSASKRAEVSKSRVTRPSDIRSR